MAVINRIQWGVYYWDFVAIHGTLKPPGTTLKEVEQPGVDGVAYKVMGRKGKQIGLVLEAVVANLTAEAAWVADMMALQGLQVKIWSATGVWQDGVVVMSMDWMRSQLLYGGAWAGLNLGGDARLLTFQLDGRYPYGV